MIYNDEELDYIAVIYEQRNQQLLDVFTSVESYHSFIDAIENDEDFRIIAVYSGYFVK